MRNIRIFDNQGATFDRYTVIMQDPETDQEDVYTMASDPRSFNQYSCTVPLGDSEPNEDEVELDSVPESIYQAVNQRFDQGN